MHDAAENGGPADHGGQSASRLSRRAVGVALAGVAAGLAGGAVLSERTTRAGRVAMPAELTAAERPAATTTYRLFGNRRGPAAAVPIGNKGLVTSLLFEMMTDVGWLEGYWLWCCDTGQSTAPQKFTLWMPYVGAHYAATDRKSGV